MRPFFRFLIVAMLILAGITVFARSIPQGELQRLQPPAAETIETPDEVAGPNEPSSPEPNGVDTTPPRIISVAILPLNVDTTEASQDISVTFRITDDLSGVGWGIIRFAPAAGGTQFLNVSVDRSVFLSGDRRDGVYETRVVLPKYAAHGRWYPVGVYIADNANNSCGEFSQYGGNVTMHPDCTLPDNSIYFVNGKDDGEPVYPQPETSVPPPGPLPPEDENLADATPWAGDMFLPALGQ